MKTISHILMEAIEEKKERFYEKYGKNPEDEKRLFVNWYIANHKAPINTLIHDLAEHCLFLEEATIIRYLNEEKSETT